MKYYRINHHVRRPWLVLFLGNCLFDGIERIFLGIFQLGVIDRWNERFHIGIYQTSVIK